MNDLDFFLEDLKEFCKTFKFEETEFIQSPIGESNPFYGCKHDDETKKHLSEMQSTKVGKQNQFFGKKHKAETIEQNRKKNIEILTQLQGKKVKQFDMDGNLIAIHDSVRSAARKINAKNYNQISKCCQGIIRYSYGYLWEYA